ncbi:MAG: hypothetical protein P8170_18610 [Gemmatimonadota bacterium]|jgi:hypothetical protein
MMDSHFKSSLKHRGGKRGGRGHLPLRLAALLILTATAACNSLLDVDLPGNLTSEDLDNPQLAETLVLGAQGDFECAYGSWIYATSAWTTETQIVDNNRVSIEMAQRLPEYWTQGGGGGCGGIALYRPLQTARVQADLALELVGSFEIDQSEKDFLMGKAHVYQGFSTQLLAEAHCEVTFDAGPLVSRTAAFERAADNFTSAIGLLGTVTSGARASEAQYLLNAAHIGRARANLNAGALSTVVADARFVTDPDYEFIATFDSEPARRDNPVYININEILRFSIGPMYRGNAPDYDGLRLTGGVEDPRIPLEHLGLVGYDNLTDVWVQKKYTSRGADMPITSWDEAQLMIAEVMGGQDAVDIINTLRARHPTLPMFSSADPAEIAAQVQDEKKKELFLEGTRIGDKLRWNEPWVTGLNQRGEPYNDNATCMPVPYGETLTNPNIGG